MAIKFLTDHGHENLIDRLLGLLSKEQKLRFVFYLDLADIIRIPRTKKCNDDLITIVVETRYKHRIFDELIGGIAEAITRSCEVSLDLFIPLIYQNGDDFKWEVLKKLKNSFVLKVRRGRYSTPRPHLDSFLSRMNDEQKEELKSYLEHE